jgi:hypothetical protein
MDTEIRTFLVSLKGNHTASDLGAHLQKYFGEMFAGVMPAAPEIHHRSDRADIVRIRLGCFNYIGIAQMCADRGYQAMFVDDTSDADVRFEDNVTLRDKFAMSALKAGLHPDLLSSNMTYEDCDKCIQNASVIAYKLADEMLKTRGSPPKE